MVSLPNSKQTPEYQMWVSIRREQGSKAAHQYYLRSYHWKLTRQTILDRDGHTCHMCHQSELPPNTLHVHHQTYSRLWCEQPKDLITLCEPCHQRLHAAGGTLKVRKFLKQGTTNCVQLNKTQKKRTGWNKTRRINYMRDIVSGVRDMPQQRPKGIPCQEWEVFKKEWKRKTTQ